MKLYEYLYILDINPLSVVYTYFFLFCGWCFHFADDFFCCARVFWFDVVLLVNFCFCLCSWYHTSKLIAKTSVKELLSSRSFTISDLILKSFIHSVLIFVNGFNFIFLHVIIQYSHHHFLKAIFSPLGVLSSLAKYWLATHMGV